MTDPIGGVLGKTKKRTYNLGAVKPWVRKAADVIGNKFGIKTVYGWAPGQFDHPKGLALDFMINNISNGKAVGDSLAAWVIQNNKVLNVTYVIWYRKYYGVENGFKEVPYTGTPNPHTDHVHVSFKATGISQEIPDSSELVDPTHGLGDLFSKFDWITTPGAWLRIGVGASGAMLLIYAIYKLGTGGIK